jgi:hypothetical protein
MWAIGLMFLTLMSKTSAIMDSVYAKAPKCVETNLAHPDTNCSHQERITQIEQVGNRFLEY